MRIRDTKRFWDLGRQLRDIREGIEPPMSTHDLARLVGRPQPWVSEVENGKRYPDLFDFVRLCRALKVEDDLAFDLLKDILDDRRLDSSEAPMAPASRPKPGAKRRRRTRRQP